MKKIIVTLASLAICTAMLSAQDIKSVTDAFNVAAGAFGDGNKVEALSGFQKVLTEAATLGDEGAEIVGKCKNFIPNLMCSIAKDTFKAGDLEGAIVKAKEALAAAKEFGIDELVTSCQKTLGQFLLQKGNNALNAKDFATAIASYKDLLDADSTNGTAALRLGMALSGSGDTAGAEEAFKQAAANGQEATANKQLGKLILKDAQKAYSSGNFQQAIDSALESVNYAPTAAAYKIAGNAAAQIKNFKDAITYMSKYLELDPAAKDAAQTKANIEAFKKAL